MNGFDGSDGNNCYNGCSGQNVFNSHDVCAGGDNIIIYDFIISKDVLKESE